MSQSLLQSELFAGQDWKVLYRAFTQVNFNATDPQSIAQSLRDYIRANYPEDFNDWIEQSEFVAIIDLLSWLAGTIAFKQDINARENFMELAEARESVLRLARFLSYNPRRCQPARGLLKVVEVRTDEDLFDATGSNLNGVTVRWNNSEDPNWYDRFMQVLNNSMVQTNPFGIPLKTGTISGTTTHLYRLNSLFGENTMSFNSRVNGTSTSFELCSVDFEDGGAFVERTPNKESAVHLVHRNDGSGNGSIGTGFFFMFKQGALGQTTFNIETPKPNRVIEIDSTNVNEDDVWVQTVSDSGAVIANWDRVPAIFSENITYNSFKPSKRNIFSVITRDDDRVAIRFADGIFANAPVGNIRVWTRSSNGEQYTIRPSEMGRVTIPVKYKNRRGGTNTISITLALQEPVANATTRETDAQIKRRAPAVFGTQNRMVTGEDYNILPLSSNVIRKLKSVNRVYSGHSRFIDLNDPTGTYQHTDVVTDDGIFYEEVFNQYSEIPISFNRTADEMVTREINPLLAKSEVIYCAQRSLTKRALDDLEFQVPVGCIWHNSTTASASSTGYFSTANSLFKVGAMIQFSFQSNGENIVSWATIGKIVDTATTVTGENNRYGSVYLNEPIPDGASVLKIVPAYVRSLDPVASNEVKQRLDDKSAFSLWFNPVTGLWSVEDGESLVTAVNDAARLPAFKVLCATYSSAGVWRISARGSRLVFESERAIKWFTDPSTIVDPVTGERKHDLVRILRFNTDLNSVTGHAFKKDYDLSVANLIRFSNGYTESARVQVDFYDKDLDGQPDLPDLFREVISDDYRENTLFWRMSPTADQITGWLPYEGMIVYNHESDRLSDTIDYSQINGEIVCYQMTASDPDDAKTFWVYEGGRWIKEIKRFRTARGRGPNIARIWKNGATTLVTTATERENLRIRFQWKHYASSDHRIDPSPSAIHDMFVLTEDYDYAMRQWIVNGANPQEQPKPPSELDLRLTFAAYDVAKMASDTMVWRPVRYKLLFGPGADPTLRASFKVVKLPNAILSDGEIKSALVKAINKYFAADAWDFGDTFYAGGLKAYIQTQLSGSIASVQIVPTFDEASFGDLEEIACRSDELFISTAQVSDVQIITSNTPTNLRMR